MTISFVGIGATVSQECNSLSIPFGSLTAGDLIIPCLANKYPPNGPSTPSGFTAPSHNQFSGGAGGAAADSGTVFATAYWKQAVSESGNLSVTIGSGNSACGLMLVLSSSPSRDELSELVLKIVRNLSLRGTSRVDTMVTSCGGYGRSSISEPILPPNEPQEGTPPPS